MKVIATISIVFACVFTEGHKAFAADIPLIASANQRSPVAELFESRVLMDNVLEVCRRAGQMSGNVRYEFLRNLTMPAGTNQLRLFGRLAPFTERLPVDISPSTEILPSVTTPPMAIHMGGVLVSPIFDLISTAKELGRLDELRQSVEALQINSEVQQRCRLSILALIAMAKGDDVAAGFAADQLFNRLLTGAFPSLNDRMPETLFVWAAAEQGLLTADAERFLVHIWDHQVQPSKLCGPGEWDRLITSLIGRVRYLKLDERSKIQAYQHAPALQDWHWVTKKYAWVAGTGIPAGHAQLMDRTVVQLSREDDEYLLFRIPLRGNFTVECECSGFGYKDCHPFVAGKWMAPVYTYDTVWIGDVTRSLPPIPLEQKLSHFDDWVRYRVEMQDGVCLRFINGRLIHEENPGPNHNPWVAIRTPSYGEGNVRDVRISGTPDIPKEVSLSAHGIETWISWHDDQLSPETFSWRAETQPANEIHLVSAKIESLSGTAAERQLRYHWPLIWDCEVGYDFYYSKDHSVVHPSIGQLAFLLTESGIKSHRITNGIWDSTDLNPLNQDDPAAEWRAQRLPLIYDRWNAMTFKIKGDSVTLELNGTVILIHELQPADDRTFGLFHYCDQSEARVRNVVLQGSWPQALPELQEQELRGVQSDQLDQQRDDLPDSFEFDFTESTPADFLGEFLPIYSNPGTESSFEMKDDGLHSAVKAPVGTMALAAIAPRITVIGDFDIIADYEKLVLLVPDEGACGIYEYLVFPLLDNRTSSVIRSVGQYSNSPFRHVTQVELIDPSRGGATYPQILADESPSGRLRTCRRGKMLTFLIAAYGTENFRLLHSDEFSDEPMQPNSIQLRSLAMSFGKQNASMNVVWKKLSVKAEKIVRD